MSIRCHLPPAAFDGEAWRAEGEEAHHLLHVLRVRPGDPVTLFDGRGRLAEARVRDTGRHAVGFEVAAQREEPRPALRPVLVQALLKSTAQDWLLQKATELGAAEIRLVHTRHAVVGLEDALRPARRERNRRIVINAARQCGAAWLPELPEPTPLDAALETVANADLLLLADLAAGTPPLRERLSGAEPPPGRVVGLVGPEGDFDAAEREACYRAGARGVRLGPRTLRAETAGLYLLTALQHALGE